MKKSKLGKLQIILCILIILWVIISSFDVTYNSLKTVSEAKHWISLSDFQKRHEIFGDIYNFINFVKNKSSEHTSILIYSDNDMVYYLGRYYLYPREISVAPNAQQFDSLQQSKKFDYVALFDKTTVVSNYPFLVSKSSGQHDFWSMYKKQ